MRPGKQEPSLQMLARMADQVGPTAVLKYLKAARAERDGLREALSLKLAVQAGKLELGKDDLLALRWPGSPKPEVVGAIEDLKTRLRQKHGWDGEILVLTGGAEASVMRLGEDDVMVLRCAGQMTDEQRQRIEDVFATKDGQTHRAMVVSGPAQVSSAGPPEVRYAEDGRLDEVVADGARVKFVHLEYMDDDHVWLRVDLERPGPVATTRWAGGEQTREVSEGCGAIVVNLSTGKGEAKGEPIAGLAETE